MSAGEFIIPSTDEIFRWIEEMYSIGPRRAGTAGGHRCEDYLANALSEIGFSDIKKDPIPMRVWEAEDYALSLNSCGAREEIPSHYIPYTAFTGDDGVEGQLLYATTADAALRRNERWDGRIVVAAIKFPKLDVSLYEKFAFYKHDPDDTLGDASHRAPWIRLNWSLYREAVKRGAAGFIGILANHYEGGQNYYAPYGFKEKDIHDKPIPGFWVDRVVGEKIRALAKKGRSSASMKLTGSLKPGVTHNVIGKLDGETDETFIIGCHHDAPFSSAVEDASGCSVALAAARHFAEARELKRTLVVAFTAGHFYGSIGTRSFIERADKKQLDNVALEYHVEHIGLEAVAKPGGLELTGRPEFTGAFASFNRKIIRALKESLVSEGLTRSLIFPAEGIFGDYPPTDGGDFHQAGVPIINTITPPIYLLNSEDTLEMVAKERLAPTARAIIRVLRNLDDVPLARLKKNDYPLRSLLMKNLGRVIAAASRRTAL